MCVICIAETGRPTEDQIRGMFEANPSGAGFAWQEGGKTHWEKGIKLERSIELAATLPMPYVGHFRIPTCGGDGPLVTHPFLIDTKSPLVLKGSTKGGVLFHNGHWSAWKERIMDTAVRHSVPLPTGPWTDSRAMAWMASVYGLGVLELIDEKAAVVYPTGEVETFSKGWCYNKAGFWTSNSSWEFRGHRRIGGWQSTNSDSSTKKEEDTKETKQTPSTGPTTGKDSAVKGVFYHSTPPASIILGPHNRLACPRSPNQRGGDPLEQAPFGQVGKWWTSGEIPPGETKPISKKRFKRLRKAWEKRQREATKQAVEAAHRMMKEAEEESITLH